jgi:hypothetical protein
VFKGYLKSLYLTKYHSMKTYWESGSIGPRILNLILVGGEWSASRPGRFAPGEGTLGTRWIGG